MLSVKTNKKTKQNKTKTKKTSPSHKPIPITNVGCCSWSIYCFTVFHLEPIMFMCCLYAVSDAFFSSLHLLRLTFYEPLFPSVVFRPYQVTCRYLFRFFICNIYCFFFIWFDFIPYCYSQDSSLQRLLSTIFTCVTFVQDIYLCSAFMIGR